MKFKIRNRKPFPISPRSNMKVSEYRTLAQLPSGRWESVERLGPNATPKRPTTLVCDCCLNQVDRLWLRRHYGWCVNFDQHQEIEAGLWGFCVYCWSLFPDQIEILVARVVTLNSDPDPPAWGKEIYYLDPVWCRESYRILAQAVYGDVITWEGGQEVPRI